MPKLSQKDGKSNSRTTHWILGVSGQLFRVKNMLFVPENTGIPPIPFVFHDHSVSNGRVSVRETDRNYILLYPQ